MARAGSPTTLRLAGVEVPRVGLGTNRLRDTAEHVAFVRAAVEAGVRHVDTAHLYTGGESERAVGAALAGVTEDVVVATKGGYGGAGQGRPEVLRAQIEQSLRSLRMDAIPLYYLHRIDPETPLEASLEAIKEYVDRGAIRHVGISDVGVGQIARARAVLPIAAVQNEYNLGERRHEDVIDHCAAEASPSSPSSRCAAAVVRWRRSRRATASRRTRCGWRGCCAARRSWRRSRGRCRQGTCARTSRRCRWSSATRTAPSSSGARGGSRCASGGRTR